MTDFVSFLITMAVLLLAYLHVRNNGLKKKRWESTFGKKKKKVKVKNKTKNIIKLKILNDFYKPDFVFIYGIKSIVFSVLIIGGYWVFWLFCCLTFDASMATYLIISVMHFIASTFIVRGVYNNKFSDYFEAQFPYALRLISRNLAVGQTIYAAIDAASENLSDIMKREFHRISIQLKNGVSFDDVLNRGEVIYPYKGYFVFSSYIRISIQKGSSLKDTLLSLANDLVAAQIIRKKTKALTSEARGAAKILALLPLIMLVVLYKFAFWNFVYLFDELYGRYVVIYVVLSVSIGFLIISKMIKGVEL